MAAPDNSVRVLDPAVLDRQATYFLLNSLVVPRPIAWVSTMASDGSLNVAPHSYMTVASVAPPILLFTSIREKDTVRNIRATGSFVVNLVDHALVEQMNLTATDAPHGVSEFGLAGLTAGPSGRIPVPRVAEAPVAMECELERIEELGTDPSFVVYGRVVSVEVAERLFDEQDRVDPQALDAVARMGGSVYSTTRDRFSLVRPKYADIAAPGRTD